jgi:hypothetical protein
MAKHWEEIGDNKFKLTLSPDEGGPASVYYGSREEIQDKVFDSQVNAIRRIEQLRTTSTPNGNGHETAQPYTQPKTLSPDERMQAVADLSNPATVDRGVTRVMESVIGPLADFNADRTERAAVAAAEAFAAELPDYFPSDENSQMVVRFLQQHPQYDPTNISSYKLAFFELSKAKQLKTITNKGDNDTEPSAELQERNAPNLPPPMAPARYSTGIRSSDVSGSQPIPSKRLKWTRESIQNMSAATYRRNMSDPEFQRAVEFFAKPQRRVQQSA